MSHPSLLWSRRAVVAAGVFIAGGARAQFAAQPKLKTAPLVIRTGSGEFKFTVELALSSDEKSTGLMFRTAMGPDEGMLFDFGHDDEVQMWMKNTILPLDMVFIRADGEVASVAENTKPYSLDVVSSRGPVRAALELNAGTARRIGVKRGDRVKNVLFGNAP